MTVSDKFRIKELSKVRGVKIGDQVISVSQTAQLRPLVAFREWVGMSHKAKVELIGRKSDQ